MPDTPNTAPRRVTPRTWAIATAAALGVATPMIAVIGAPAAHASEAGESGEGGEAGVVRHEGTAGFLTDLALFEAAHRIVDALYQLGEIELALAQLEGSHHAFYDDLAPGVAAYGAAGFEHEAQSFAQAVADVTSTETVAARFSVLLSAINTAREAASPTASQRVLALKTLLDTAAADYAGGVEAGEVVIDHEYRDAWGFVETVRARAQVLAIDDDPTVAAAGSEILGQLLSTAPLFPDLLATQTSGDPAALSVAAAWVEIVALRLR